MAGGFGGGAAPYIKPVTLDRTRLDQVADNQLQLELARLKAQAEADTPDPFDYTDVDLDPTDFPQQGFGGLQNTSFLFDALRDSEMQAYMSSGGGTQHYHPLNRTYTNLDQNLTKFALFLKKQAEDSTTLWPDRTVLPLQIQDNIDNIELLKEVVYDPANDSWGELGYAEFGGRSYSDGTHHKRTLTNEDNKKRYTNNFSAFERGEFGSYIGPDPESPQSGNSVYLHRHFVYKDNGELVMDGDKPKVMVTDLFKNSEVIDYKDKSFMNQTSQAHKQLIDFDGFNDYRSNVVLPVVNPNITGKSSYFVSKHKNDSGYEGNLNNMKTTFTDKDLLDENASTILNKITDTIANGDGTSISVNNLVNKSTIKYDGVEFEISPVIENGRVTAFDLQSTSDPDYNLVVQSIDTEQLEQRANSELFYNRPNGGVGLTEIGKHYAAMIYNEDPNQSDLKLKYQELKDGRFSNPDGGFYSMGEMKNLIMNKYYQDAVYNSGSMSKLQSLTEEEVKKSGNQQIKLSLMPIYNRANTVGYNKNRFYMPEKVGDGMTIKSGLHSEGTGTYYEMPIKNYISVGRQDGSPKSVTFRDAFNTSFNGVYVLGFAPAISGSETFSDENGNIVMENGKDYMMIKFTRDSKVTKDILDSLGHEGLNIKSTTGVEWAIVPVADGKDIMNQTLAYSGGGRSSISRYIDQVFDLSTKNKITFQNPTKKVDMDKAQGWVDPNQAKTKGVDLDDPQSNIVNKKNKGLLSNILGFFRLGEKQKQELRDDYDSEFADATGDKNWRKTGGLN